MKKVLLGVSMAVLTLSAKVAAAATILPAGTTAPIPPSGGIVTLLTNLLNWLFLILGALGVGGFLIAGILYVTAAGEQTRIDSAKKTMTYSIVGVIVGLAGYIAVKTIETWIGGSTIS